MMQDNRTDDIMEDLAMRQIKQEQDEDDKFTEELEEEYWRREDEKFMEHDLDLEFEHDFGMFVDMRFSDSMGKRGICSECHREQDVILEQEGDGAMKHDKVYEIVSHHIYAQWDYSCSIKDTCPGKCSGSGKQPYKELCNKCTLQDMCYPCWCNSYYKSGEEQVFEHSLTCERCE